MNILIAEPLAAAGIELFQSHPGWNTIVSNPKEYAQHLATADALLVRSAVQVDRLVLENVIRARRTQHAPTDLLGKSVRRPNRSVRSVLVNQL